MEPIQEAPFSLLEESTNTSTQMVKMMMNEVGSDVDSGVLDQSIMMISVNDEQIRTGSSSSFQENLKLPVGVPTVKQHHHSLENKTISQVDEHQQSMVQRHPSSPKHRKGKSMTPTSTTTPTTTNDAEMRMVPAVSPLTEGHPSPTSNPSSSAMMESPTSVMTEVGIGGVSGMSTIAGNVDGSPSSTHIDMLEHERRHRIRHQLDLTATNDENSVTPQDLLGRLQHDPLSFGSHYQHSFRNNAADNNDGLISRRMQEIESKKVSLHQKRISLEQRLYEFVDSEKRMRVMIGSVPSSNMSLNLTYSTCSMASPKPTSNSSSPHTMKSLLEPPTPSPKKLQQQLQPVFQNGDEMVQDYAWTDPRTKQIAYRYSGPLNKMKQPHGWGTMHFPDGQVYEGQIYNGYRWGMGTNTWKDGQVYCGEWEDHSRNGRGTHVWKDGRRVNGQWRGGHLNGRVIFSWPNGASFDGECRMGKKHGRGTHTFANGKLYNGNYVNGKEEGFGSLTHGDWKYRGQFKAGKREGYGMQIWRNKTYDGEWSNNKAHGKGRIVWQNGSTYTGEFRMGKYHGLGVYLFPSRKKYVGSWANGCKHGQGIYTWPSGKSYDGGYINGLKEGYGRMTWPDGSMYCGSFRKGLKEGRGIQTSADGSMRHCGIWKNDKPYFEGERVSMMSTSFDSSDSIVSRISLSDSALFRQQFGCQNTSEEDIVIMESQSVAVAEETMHSSRSPSNGASVSVKEAKDQPNRSDSLALAPELKIPFTPTKMDDVSSIASDQDTTPNLLIAPTERISL